MKFLVLISMLFSIGAFAQMSQNQDLDLNLWEVSEEVMYDLGANPRLDPEVISVKIIDQLGSRIKVKFQYTEEMYGKKTCTYYYDLKLNEVRAGSALCGA